MISKYIFVLKNTASRTERQQNVLLQATVTLLFMFQMKTTSRSDKMMSNEYIQMRAEMKLTVFCRNIIIWLQWVLTLHFWPGWLLISWVSFTDTRSKF